MIDNEDRRDEPQETPAQQAEGRAVARRPWYRRRERVVAVASGVALALGVAIGIPLASASQITTSSVSAASGSVGYATQRGSQATQWGFGSQELGNGGYGQSGDGTGSGFGQSSGESDSSESAATTASSTQSRGVVIINTDLKYDDAEAAGTGMVLTSGGLVLTNNHVVEGATTIEVTVPSSGRKYTATVVGTDASEDVALLKLSGASGLATITADDDSESVGQSVTAVGNAEGQGVLAAASGEITALKSSVTTAAEGVVASETLDDMIQVSADIVSGDSGGALLDSEGEVVGMTTAASSGTATVVGYAIPIENALAVVKQIENGDTSDGVTLGYPAFLGVQVSSEASTGLSNGYGASGYGDGTTQNTVSGALIAGVIDGTPAAESGLSTGDTITAVGGTAVSSASDLTKDLASYRPGQKVSVTWVDTAGSSHTATVTLTTGPAA